MKFKEGDKVICTEDDYPCIYIIKGLEEKSRTKYICEDITPLGPREWHEKEGGGVFVTQDINGFFGEEFIIHKKYLEILNKDYE